MSFLKKYKKIIFSVLGIVIFLFIIFLNREISLHPLVNINYWYLLIVFFLMYLATILAATRWGWIINSLQGREIIPYRKYFFYFSLSSLLGSFGFQELSVFSTQAGTLLLEKISFKKIINTYLIDKFFNTINLISTTLVSILYFVDLIDIKFAVILVIVFFLIGYLVISYFKINFTLLIFYLNKLFTKLAKILPFLKIKSKKETEEDKKVALPSKIIRKIYLLSFVKFVLFATSIFFIFKALNLNINPIQAILAFPITQLTLVFAITPGGLGILETSWFGMLKIIGFKSIDINTFLIGSRVISYIAIAIITFINYLLFLTVKNKNL